MQKTYFSMKNVAKKQRRSKMKLRKTYIKQTLDFKLN
jgi:hypothetical protein